MLKKINYKVEYKNKNGVMKVYKYSYDNIPKNIRLVIKSLRKLKYLDMYEIQIIIDTISKKIKSPLKINLPLIGKEVES